MAGASPLSAHLDGARLLEDAGAAAIVLHSLFEEQITETQSGRIRGMGSDDPRFVERLAAFPSSTAYPFGPDEYLEHLRQVKAAVGVPVIASLNGTTAEAWLKYARLLQEAGADALEVNFYEVVTDFALPAIAIERQIVDRGRRPQARSADSGLRQVVAILHRLWQHGALSRRGRCRWNCHLQSVLSTGH